MSTLAEIEAALAQLPPADWLELRGRMDARTRRTAAAPEQLPTRNAPDFLARQKEIFGARVLPDSQSILDELRAERF